MPASDGTAALVVAMEAQLAKFEKQMKEAGNIADREVKNIEGRFARANPQFSGSFLGSFLGNIAAQGFGKIVNVIEDLVARFRDLEKVSKLVNVQMNDLFGLQEVGSKLGVPIEDVTKGVRDLAVLLDQMQRGEQNTLSKLFDANPAALKGINREALTFQQTFQVVADLVRNARTEVQKIDLARAAGQAEAMVPLLEKGGAEIAKLQKSAADAAPDLQRLANLAKDFDKAWNEAIKNLKAYIVTDFADVALEKLADLVDIGIKFNNLFKGGIFSKIAEGEIKSLEDIKAALDKFRYSRVADAFGTADKGPPRTLADRQSGNVAGGGTSTRDSKSPLSNVPVTPKETDRFTTQANSIEKRTEALKAENDAIDQGTAARERSRIAAELETVAKQINKEAGLGANLVTAEQRKRIDEVAEAYGRAAAAIEQAHAPLESFARESANVGKQLNQFAATSLDGMTNALASVVTGSKTAAEAFKQLADSVINDLARIAIRQAITGPIAKALTGFDIFSVGGVGNNAQGTDNWRGGPTWVGENGPEILNLPKGSQVIPNNVATRAGGSQAPSIVYAPTIDARGADAAAVGRLAAAMAEDKRNFSRNVMATVRGNLRLDAGALGR